MSVKAVNFKLSDDDISDVRRAAKVYNKTMTDIVRDAIHEYMSRVKKDPFFRLTEKVEDASAEENAEILAEIENLSDDDLTISSIKKFTV